MIHRFIPFSLFCLLGPFVFIMGCKDKPPVIVPETTFTITCVNKVDGIPVNLDDTTYAYTNAAGNKYNVSALKYYISNVSLVKEDGDKVFLGGYFLMDESKPSTLTRTFKQVPAGIYKGLEYFIGLDSLHNHTGDQAGDLDPAYGMIWTWATGYRFLVLEGKYISNQNTHSGFVFHVALDTNLVVNKHAFPAISIQDKNVTATLECNVNEIFQNPWIWDFNADGSFMESFPNQIPQSVKISNNMGDMFRLVKIE